MGLRCIHNEVRTLVNFQFGAFLSGLMQNLFTPIQRDTFQKENFVSNNFKVISFDQFVCNFLTFLCSTVHVILSLSSEVKLIFISLIITGACS